ncbi:hypothetical protein BSKO_04690 [Bryopsis sp. KO-2023]|nr:hypothetical protein BSKO_04690 [Bryopsis sp. KO-2023]
MQVFSMLVKVLVVVGGLILVCARILWKNQVRWASKRSKDGRLADIRQRILEDKPTSRSEEVNRDSFGTVLRKYWRLDETLWRGGEQATIQGYAEKREVGSITRSPSRKENRVSRAKRARPRLGIETASRTKSVSLVLTNSEERTRFVCARDAPQSHANPIAGLLNVTAEGDVMHGASAGRRTANPGLPGSEVVKDVSALEEWCRPPQSVRGLSQGVPLPQGQRIIRLQISPLPFHKGLRHQVFHAGYTSAKVQCGRPPPVVLKKCSSETGDLESKERLARMESNAIVLGLAGLFNQKLKSLPRKLPAGWERLRFVKESFVHTLGDSQVRYFLEPFLGRDFEKVASNGLQSEEMPKKARDLLEAFAHWTYTKSGGVVMVTQCQVIKADGVFWLRNPVLSCSFQQGSEKTTAGCSAMGQFLNKHKCNKYCHAVGANRDQVPKPLKERVKKILASIEKRAKSLRPIKFKN